MNVKGELMECKNKGECKKPLIFLSIQPKKTYYYCTEVCEGEGETQKTTRKSEFN